LLSSKNYQIPKAGCKQQEEELNFKYQSALKRLQENPNDETRLEAENLKNELEALYDKKVEGITI